MTPSLQERAELLSIAMPCSLQCDKHEDAETATAGQAQWYSTQGNGNKSEHRRTVLSICLL